MTVKDKTALVDQLRERQAKLVDKWGEYIAAREKVRAAFEAREATADNQPTDEERQAFAAAEEDFRKGSDAREAEIVAIERRIKDQDSIVNRRNKAAKAAAKAGTDIRVKSEPLTYRNDNAVQVSYFRDLAAVMVREAAFSTVSIPEATDRLFRHAKEMDVEMPKRARAAEARAAKRVEEAENDFLREMGKRSRRSIDFDPFERRVNPNRTDGQGGYFVQLVAA